MTTSSDTALKADALRNAVDAGDLPRAMKRSVRKLLETLESKEVVEDNFGP